MSEMQLWVDKIRSGDRLALSKAITLIESDLPEQQEDKLKLVSMVENIPSYSFRLAVTGVPGAGKSTLIDRLGMHWIEAGYNVAVLAVDPSSSISQGSILGDKTRMTELSKSKNAFIRPSPTRLHLGGVAGNTYETILLCETAGFERIIIETVGVGQSETIASHLTDCCLLLLVTGTGDDLQGVKKGILESADFILVNKADGQNLEPAKAFSRELKSISSLWPNRATGKKAEILLGSSVDETGLQILNEKLDQYFELGKKEGWLDRNRKEQKVFWFEILLKSRLSVLFRQNPLLQTALENAKSGVLNSNQSVSLAVDQLIRILTNNLR